MSAPIDPLTQVVIEATVKAAISKGCKTTPKAAGATWDGLKELIAKWSGDKREEVAEAIQEVVDDPTKTSRQKGLGAVLAEIGTAPPRELVKLAEELNQILNADSAAADKTGHVTQIVSNVTHSAVAQSAGNGDAVATMQYREPSQRETDALIDSMEKLRSRLPEDPELARRLLDAIGLTNGASSA